MTQPNPGGSNYGIVKSCECPYCGHLLDDATTTGDRDKPKPGDISICINCSGAMEFDASLQPQVLTDAVRSSLPPGLQAHLRRVAAAIKEIHR